ncbi:hypothetical protein IFR05_001513 [Cadophora sp. M221]|nr:hypothetical protein IFR05_001513 [Cadophora sp. M221]
MGSMNLSTGLTKCLDTITNAIESTKHALITDPIAAGIVISAIIGKTTDLKNMSSEEQDQFVATLVRQQAVDYGYISAWKLLVDVTPTASVYGRLKAGTYSPPFSQLRMSIGSMSTYESIYQIGPKSLGGNARRANMEYKGFMEDPGWNATGYSKGVPPCVAMVQDIADVVALQLLSTVDFDLDQSSDNILGVESGFECAVRHTSAAGTPLQKASFLGMLNYDLQNDIRPIQNSWAAESNGPWNLGPADVSPEDWTARTGIANGMIFLQCQDLIFDTGCSNRVATVPYAEAAGVARYGVHAGYAVAVYSATAKHIFNGNDVPFGYSAVMCAGPWSPFSTRYRVWEHCVKYVRQLKKSDPGHLLELSYRDLMVKRYNLNLAVGFVKYFVPVSDVSKVPGVIVPDLCQACVSAFEKVMHSQELEEIHALEGLPDVFVVQRVWLSLYVELRSLMQDEAVLGASEWMLQNYLVGCVGLWPISMPFLLSGFDLMAELSFEDGAMGERDIVDI